MPEDDKYDVLEKIGHGSFGVIRKVRRKQDGYILCRKEISYSKMSQKEREQLQAELSILKELRHPNIVAYYERDHIKASQDLHLYMEYCGNGDLGRVIRDLRQSNKLADEEFVWTIFAQIVSALYRCHYGEDAPPPGRNVMGLGANAKPRSSGKPMILHRDLKPENIFLDSDNSVKLGDFGLSKILQSHDFASTYVGTPFYMSPEICKAEQYTLHSDIWALGCIIYELCARQPPFNAKTHFELIQKIKIGKYDAIPSVYSAELGKVIQSCLQVFPRNRPDTAQLMNMPVVKLMRKEQDIVEFAHKETERAASLMKEAREKMAQAEAYRKELDSNLRREWEVRATLEIERRVKQQVDAKLEELKTMFEEEVNKRVAKELERHPARLSTSPRLAPRSSTPTMPDETSDIFPQESEQLTAGKSTSTLGTASDFPSSTDISTLSLEDSDEPTMKQVPAKKPARQPLTRARTMFANPVAAPVPPSPMDVTMLDPSPAPATIANLSLSPRRNAIARGNIFTAARKGATSLQEIEIPPSPTEEEWNGDFDEEDEDMPIVPSPTRARSASGTRTNNEDPFKVLAAGQKPLLKPSQRLAGAPSLVPAMKARPASAVPIIATSPSRPKKSVETGSPVRKMPNKTTSDVTGLKGKGLRHQAIRNNGVQGRTLVELQQARGIPVQALSEDEGKKGARLGFGLRSPTKTRSAVECAPVWDPDVDEMPSPFIVRGKKMVK
ncbi:calcium/calmodulin-dependent protein kinase type 2 beta chain [Polyplosphaeria fusca]|uniref:non-specific serine/threonine protein kinase n=1 Tax=Polyplosphaeria fusca TaxID=682080 RepID=A0A9P4RD25_9PLEO|nr:calcium/calmodulin-dependent protein kinase type 2 beta chain [Polyplosphaeria fusca]